jgi:exopolysaccharide biosynthesis polyprenyl glycosylphosphotransferase
LRWFLDAVRGYAADSAGFSGVVNTWFLQSDLGNIQFCAALLIALTATGNYRPGDRRRDPRRLLFGSTLGVGLTFWAPIWSEGSMLIATAYAPLVMVVWLLLLVERLAVHRLVRALGLTRRSVARTLFIGSEQDCRLAQLGRAFGHRSRYRAVGTVETDAGMLPDGLQSIPHLLLARRADAVVVCSYLDDEAFQSVVQATREAGCELWAVARRFSVTGVEPQLVWKRGQPVIELTSPSVKGQEQVVKRAMDVMIAAIGLLCLLPLFALIAAAIKLDSRGPVFYRCCRWGRFGRRITIWKFRTMVHGAADLLDSDPQMRAAFDANRKLTRDPRVTRVGQWLRRRSIDELPQLFNVLRGEMSLVGPRPKLLGEEKRYGAAMDAVLAARPGLTGLWQISGRNSTTYDERIALDVKYASHPSLWEDLRILVRTVPEVLRANGAH